MSTLTLIRGLPGSGKSTLAEMMLTVDRVEGRTAAWFEADTHFVQPDGTYQYDPEQRGFAHWKCFSRADRAMASGLDRVIVSNTFTTRKEMVRYVKAARKRGYDVQIITMTADFGSTHDVPAETMAAMLARFNYDVTGLLED